MYKVGDNVEVQNTLLTTIKTTIIKVYEYTDIFDKDKKYYRYQCSHNPNIYYASNRILGYAK